MIDAPKPDMWAALRARRPSYDEALETEPVVLPGDFPGVLYGVDQQGDLHLLLPVDGPPPGTKPQDLRGLRIRHRRLAGLGQYLDLVSASCHERLFSPLCAEILGTVVEQKRRPWEAAFATIRAWQLAWKASAPAMEKIVQVGLYGELLALEHVVIPAIGTRAIHHWSGPDQECHDFVGSRLDIEVKTTRKSRHEHEISRFDQLRAPDGRRLLVVSLLLEESAQGAESLATRIDAISDLIRADPEASDMFQSKLVQIGWTDEMRRTGELLRFNPNVDSIILAVEGAFPRLPDDFALPPGVVSLRYTVDLANLPVMDRAEMLEAVRTLF